MKVRDIAPYGVRMPADLKDKLQDMAKRNGRSLNSEIVRILEEYMTPPSIPGMRPLTEDEIRHPEKVHAWMAELSGKLSAIEGVIKKYLPDHGNK